jgi:branched-chain amino acid transport system ATP-binding protein
MTAAALDVAGLSAGYGQTRILDAIGFSVPAGGRLALLGRNGMGKSTLLATIAGQTSRHAGSIRLGGRDIAGLDGPARALAGLGYVPQGRAIFRSLTVEENLLVGLQHRPRSALGEAYDLFPRLHERRRNPAIRLSGGEQQMLTIARAILGQPTLLLLDEPLEGLAPAIAGQLLAAIRQLAAGKRTTIVIVEQQLVPVLAFSDAVLILERGRIAWSGTPAQLDSPTMNRLLGLGPTQAGTS